LIIGLLLEWRRAEEALALSSSTHNATAEILKMSLESRAGHAQRLTQGLRELRNGNTHEGYLALDRLLLALIREIDPDGPSAENVREAKAYLEEVGDPWQR
jgi:hypothetical protein